MGFGVRVQGSGVSGEVEGEGRVERVRGPNDRAGLGWH